MSEKRFYWMKLQEDFFENDAIQWLEEQKHGKEFVLLFLKLCLKSIKSNGVLIRRVGSMTVPYDTAKLAEITRTEFKTTYVGMEALKKSGLIEMLDNGAIRIGMVADMIGSEASSAERVRQHRERAKQEHVTDGALQCNANVTASVTQAKQNGNTDIESIELKNIELELDRDREAAKPPRAPSKEKRKNAMLSDEEYAALVTAMPELQDEQKPQKRQYGEYKNVLLTDEEYQKLTETYPDAKDRIERLSEYIASTGKVYKNHYATIRSWAKRDEQTAAVKPNKATGAASTGSEPSSFDCDEFFAAAVQKSYGG